MTTGEMWRRDPAWARVGHEVGQAVRTAVDHGGIAVVNGGGERYVQLHSVPGEGLMAEADSGEFSRPLTAEQRRHLVALGWSPPADDEARPANHRIERAVPIDVYALVLMIVATLVEVYGSRPDDVVAELIACVCGHGPREVPG